ncbi:MAG: heat shock protein HspQ [Proteobacteria bacterium]|nr:MAG: heat shock protein HspQ [Pseudomonadota bacterium]QKK11050.1 MAG: heat shock protein HspQ [Pseudomonadota bacterium]
MVIPQARYSVGQLVHHKLFDYRGVIFDVDAVFMGSDAWYEQVARSHPPKDRPWYHVLVDGADHTTYVAERNLESDASGVAVNHPLLGKFFTSFDGGQYQTMRREN